MDTNENRNREADLGPRVLGQARYEQVQREAAVTHSGHLGPRVTDPLPIPGTHALDAERQAVETPATEGISVKRLVEELAKDPESVAMYFAMEQARPDKRKTALRALAEAELKKPEPDMRVVGAINDALNLLDED